eukprot:jgi/Bigna1/129756/aug1.9_g4464
MDRPETKARSQRRFSEAAAAYVTAINEPLSMKDFKEERPRSTCCQILQIPWLQKKIRQKFHLDNCFEWVVFFIVVAAILTIFVSYAVVQGRTYVHATTNPTVSGTTVKLNAGDQHEIYNLFTCTRAGYSVDNYRVTLNNRTCESNNARMMILDSAIQATKPYTWCLVTIQLFTKTQNVNIVTNTDCAISPPGCSFVKAPSSTYDYTAYFNPNPLCRAQPYSCTPTQPCVCSYPCSTPSVSKFYYKQPGNLGPDTIPTYKTQLDPIDIQAVDGNYSCYFMNIFENENEGGLPRTVEDPTSTSLTGDVVRIDIDFANYMPYDEYSLCNEKWTIVNYPPTRDIGSIDLNNIKIRNLFNSVRKSIQQSTVRFVQYRDIHGTVRNTDSTVKFVELYPYPSWEVQRYFNNVSLYFAQNDLQVDVPTFQDQITTSIFAYFGDLFNLATSLVAVIFGGMFCTTIATPIYFAFGRRARAAKKAYEKETEAVLDHKAATKMAKCSLGNRISEIKSMRSSGVLEHSNVLSEMDLQPYPTHCNEDRTEAGRGDKYNLLAA